MYSGLTVYPLGVLYANLVPLIGEHSIQFACGAEGQARRKLHDSAFSHEKLINQFPLFQEVRKCIYLLRCIHKEP